MPKRDPFAFVQRSFCWREVGRNTRKEEVIKRGECQIFVKEKIIEKPKIPLDFHNESKFLSGSVWRVYLFIIFVFLTIILKSRILTCRFFDFILVSKLLNLDFFADIARLLVRSMNDQINKLLVYLFSR